MILCGAASAETLYANNTGWYRSGDAFNTTATPLQHAVDNATSGDTVYIWNGSYNENVDISTAHLTIEGEGRELVTVNALSDSDYVFDVQENYINISGITATGSTHIDPKDISAGIYINGTDHCNINNNIITGNHYGVYLDDSSNYNAITNNIVNLSYNYGITLQDTLNNIITDNNVDSNGYGSIQLRSSNYTTLTNNTANSNTFDGIYLRNSYFNTLKNNTVCSNGWDGTWSIRSSHNIFDQHNSTNNDLVGESRYDYFAGVYSVNNTLLNCDLTDSYSMMNDSTSQWIIKYTDGRIIDTDDPALQMTCYADNCTLILEPNTNDYTLNMTTLDVTVSATTGSVSVSANNTLLSIDYANTKINDLNITALDRPMILESAGVQTMIFTPTNIFNLWDFEYYINATANRKAVSFDTYTTNATNRINFTFYDLYPSANFDCKYNSISFATNTSGTTGTLEFNKSSWTANVTRTVEIYMTTTPYRCCGVCAVEEGTPMMLYLDLNDSTVSHVRAEITKPNGAKANNSMTSFIYSGATSWYIAYADTGNAGTYPVSNFYSSKDGSSWKQLDSFLTFESRSTSGGGGGGSTPDDGDDEGEIPNGAGGGGGAQPDPTPKPDPEEHAIKPDKQFTAELTNGRAKFTGSIVTRVVTNQSGNIRINEFKINPTTTSLIGGTRYGYADIAVPNRNIGGTVCFVAPTTDTPVAIYHLEDNEWVELKTRSKGAEVCADTGHFSYFALADEAMESVIESMTQLSFDYPKVDGIMFWKWLSDEYTSTHTANRELTNVSTSDGIICEILTTGDYPNRTLKCTYTPPEDAEWSSLKYQGEIIAVDTEGYTRRIPVKLSVYNMGKLGFPLLTGFILLGGFILYRYPPK